MNATNLVMADLAAALDDLESARGSPKEVRRAFTRFVDLTQKLTSTMRTDFRHMKGAKWDAASFRGWNQVTGFFKWIRNHDQHDSPIRISVHERRFYENPAVPGEYFPFEGTWVLDDQLTEHPPRDGITFYPVDPVTGAQLPPRPPVRIEYQYLVQWPNEKARRQLQAIGTTDVHQLSARCFDVLKDYHAYFLDALGA